MIKHCVFCGKKIHSKERNLEHVIPYWLLELTGDPNRVVYLGYNWNSRKKITFAFDQLVFPSCLDCNSNYSSKEGITKGIILNILNEGNVSCESFDKLLGWFDKVRVGLWLGYRYLYNNYFDFTPHYYISDRIGLSDRMLLIYKTNSNKKGIQLFGVDSPFFSYNPSCFGLVINKYYFLNVSTHYLFSRRLGLPFPQKIILNDKCQLGIDKISAGMGRVLLPLIKMSYDRRCAEIYQPIYLKELLNDDENNVFKSDYCKKYFNYFKNNKGNILLLINGKITNYSDIKENCWIPDFEISRHELSKILYNQILLIHLYLLKLCPKYEGDNKMFSAIQKRQTSFILNFIHIMLNNINNKKLIY
ncbi:MAG: hypothetical protein NT009_10010 [Proteobacteria bacterium]|nr:hypothetical protein [Pseudomonadota bacterium]